MKPIPLPDEMQPEKYIRKSKSTQEVIILSDSPEKIHSPLSLAILIKKPVSNYPPFSNDVLNEMPDQQPSFPLLTQGEVIDCIIH